MSRRFSKILVVALVLLPLSIAGILAGVDTWITRSSKDRVYSSVEAVPPREYALVLGTSPALPDGRPNLYFARRMDAAARLYHHGRVRRLILSGGAGPGEFDEPAAMQKAMVARGLPEDVLILDPAGYRTLDSVVRAREIFNLREVTVVSQEFHIQRALFIAERRDLEAIGFAADDVSGFGGIKVNLRELLARLKAVLDLYLLDTQPADLAHPEESAARGDRK